MFTTSYAFGPGYYDHVDKTTGEGKSPRGMKYMEPSFRPPSIAPMDEGTHSGEDVGVFVSGPYSHVSYLICWFCVSVFVDIAKFFKQKF